MPDAEEKKAPPPPPPQSDGGEESLKRDARAPVSSSLYISVLAAIFFDSRRSGGMAKFHGDRRAKGGGGLIEARYHQMRKQREALRPLKINFESQPPPSGVQPAPPGTCSILRFIYICICIYMKRSRWWAGFRSLPYCGNRESRPARTETFQMS